MLMLITIIVNNCTKPASYNTFSGEKKPSRARQVAFGMDILLGIGLVVVGALAMKGKFSDISSLVGSKLVTAGALYSVVNVVGTHYLIENL
jgi:hypothetical protein